MNLTAHAIGQAIFIRTDSIDYEEVAVPFKTLEEMVNVCIQPRRAMTLEKILVYSTAEDGLPVSLTLGYIASTRGQQPGHAAEFAND
jgi:hypothetical protein